MATIKAIEARSVHQIQSGQVITDLCSVAKELVENSLDAKATTIEIRFKDNGLDLIEVQDNGSGISPENYENVALKHYTSKLSSYTDLGWLNTYGFRGEALSSLCALSDFHVVTAEAHQVPIATKLEFEVSGKLAKKQVVAGRKGTTVSVGTIFKRLPVRRRELEKNIKREYGKVINLLHAYACISAGVSFSVRNTVGKTKNVSVFSTNGNRTIKENIANVYGAKTLFALMPLELDLEFEPSNAMRRANGDNAQSNRIQVRGHISRPVLGEGRQTPDRQMFFVNSRPCTLPQIAKAFNEVYKSFNVSQSPFVFADLQMDTSAYDVNVSPDKRTILLHDAAALVDSLKASLTEMFELADQTVPHAQLGSKSSARKQQSLGSLPGFVTARQVARGVSESPTTTSQEKESTQPDGDEPETQKRTTQSGIGRFMNLQDDSSQPDFPSSPIRSDKEIRRDRITTVIDPPRIDDGTSSVQSQGQEEGVAPEEQNEDPANPPPELSSQPSEAEQMPSSNTQESEETPNMVQNAFDRMRPRRMPAEMATITIAGRTVTSMVGSGLPRKRTSSSGTSTNEPSKRKRLIHTPSRPNIFGKHMRAFAAPGTQTEEEDDEADDFVGIETEQVEENQSEVDDEEIEEVEMETEQEVEDQEENASSPAPEDDECVPEKDMYDNQEATSKELTVETSQSDLDEAEKKAQEDAKVQRLIHQAEETAVLPEQHSVSRANKMNKGATHRDATFNLISTIDTSVSKLRSQMDKLRECLQPRDIPSQADDPDVDEKTAEERLSLTVSKADFAQMRIIGQFNLGFILAVRPGDDHDELFIIDQHASDEKFNFERLQAETVVQNQRLVCPQRLDLTAVEEEIVLENRPALEKNGFIVTVDESGDEPIGRRCQLVSLPLSKEVVFDSKDLEELLVLLSEAPVNHEIFVPRPSKVRKMFAIRACRSSIMIGKTLTLRQMQRVVRNMGTIDKPWNCPHGRPTMRHLMGLDHYEEWDEYGPEDPEDPEEM
ncbi:uncharacterized protein N7483_008472 [Penicillium malachiteum]|uniref:uncharacterized protein n=1 Tax=Penicillium malachiteum TaxID=1324776 RepID=UPI0025480F25|nr:uncharacterized protein N7483_008472 [Penicillium malachiteum]KAJ5720538.1 hypothetical protein N7483_008472 [Penicillium malachiteum]